ncbi:MAG: hypothetical protein HXX13_09810 [Bacteroidetes bacterium]|nr:hypothetical protein [Bacteroidota bacterium]
MKFMNGPTLGYIDAFKNREIMNDIAIELKGEFRVHLSTSNIIEYHTISIPYKKWEIVLSISDTTPLKISIPFATHSDFEMVLGLEDFTDKLMKKLGKSEITLGWDTFDNKYFIQSNKPDLLKSVITSDIQKEMLKRNIYSLSFQTDSKHNYAVLTSVIQRNTGSKEMILELIEMFKVLLDRLKEQKIIE